MSSRLEPREVTAVELQKDYARVIRDAEYGHPTTVTRHGKPVAKVVPPGDSDLDPERVDRALRHVVALLDYDLHKELEDDEGDGEGGYGEHVTAFIAAYQGAGERS